MSSSATKATSSSIGTIHATERAFEQKFSGKSDSVRVGLGQVVDPVVVDAADVLKPPQGQRWVAYPAKITNTSGTTVQMSSLCVRAVLTNGKTVSAKAVSPYGDSLSRRLRPGEDAISDAVFDVPQGASIREVKVDCSLGSSKAATILVK